MLLNSLANIEKILMKSINEEDRIIFDVNEKKIFFSFFISYKMNEIINPYNLIGSSLFSKERAIKIFKVMTKEMYLKPVYKVICPNCNRLHYAIYERITDIIEEFLCPDCECSIENINFNKILVLYKVIKE